MKLIKYKEDTYTCISNQGIQENHYEKRDRWILDIAKATAQMSKDTSKCGAVLVTPDYSQFSCGYNGMPRGVYEEDLWQDKHNYVVHAELNALLNAPFDRKGCILYCTFKPCFRCAGLLVNSQLSGVVYINHIPGSSHDTDHVADMWLNMLDHRVYTS